MEQGLSLRSIPLHNAKHYVFVCKYKMSVYILELIFWPLRQYNQTISMSPLGKSEI